MKPAHLLLIGSVLALQACDSSPAAPERGQIPQDCSEALDLPQLSLGQAIRLTGTELSLLCLPESTEGPVEYLLVLHHGAEEPSDSLHVSIRGEGISPPDFRPPTTPTEPMARSGRGDLGAPWPPDPFRNEVQHHDLRQVEERELPSLIKSLAPGPPALSSLGPRPTPEVGDQLEFNAGARAPACTEPTLRTGRVEAISNRAIVVADTLNPAGGFNRRHYAHYAATFDTLIAPLAEGAFGTPSDIDGNGRVILFFTQEVNRLSSPGSESFVGGFFFSRDLFPAEGSPNLSACPASNEAEILYLLVPDPWGQVNENPRSLDFVQRMTDATLVHEYQHLINAARRLHINRSAGFPEATWLNEGLSHIAEELLFYRSSDLSPRSNLDVETLLQGDGRRVDALNRHQLANAQRFRTFLRAPAVNSPLNNTDRLATRGASWHFLRYVADRREGSDAAFLRSLVNGSVTGRDNLAAAVGGNGELQRLLADWSVALYTDSRIPGVNTRFRDLSWNHASIFKALDQQSGHSNPAYPLATIPLSSGEEKPLRAMGGGSLFLRFAAHADQESTLRVQRDGLAPPSHLQGTLVRVF